jgi:hypothetical protein
MKGHTSPLLHNKLDRLVVQFSMHAGIGVFENSFEKEDDD